MRLTVHFLSIFICFFFPLRALNLTARGRSIVLAERALLCTSLYNGSVAIVDTKYVKTGTKNHCKHIVRERLGKILYVADDKKSGIFLLPTRGLVEYNSVSDSFNEIESDDVRIDHDVDNNPTEIHTVFGDTFLFLNFLKKSGLIAVLRSVFPKDTDYQRLLCHLMHSVLKDGSHITCDNFILKSFTSYINWKEKLFVMDYLFSDRSI